jgi:hypothetical protein
MTLQNYISSLSIEKQLKLAVRLAKLALPIWENYAGKNKLAYRDSVVGLKHTVIKDLLKETIDLIEQYPVLDKPDNSDGSEDKILTLYRKFSDPVIALQDSDWELPDEVTQTFYSIYNLIDTIIEGRQIHFSGISFYVSINQVIDALDISETLSSDEIDKILDDIQNEK